MIRPPALRVLCAGLAAFAATGVVAVAQSSVAPSPVCVRDVVLDRTGDGGERFTLLLRDGRIEAVLDADSPLPAGMKIIEANGQLALPGFLDAFSTTGCETPQPAKDRDLGFDASADVQIDMRLANRKGVQPSFLVADALAISTEQAQGWREAGFGTVLVAPHGQLLAGTSALATTREAAMRDVIVRPAVFAHAEFRATGGGYPSTLMAHFAQLRQFFYDVAWQSERQMRYEQGRPGVRPPFDADLAAGVDLITQKARLVCAAESHRDIERWIRLADEFELDIAISGGRDAWRVATVLAEREIPVLLTLDWGKEVEDPRPKPEPESEEAIAETPAPEEPAVDGDGEADWAYEEPLGVRIDRRLRWEEGRDCALRLHEAGVAFAFGTGDEKPQKTLEKVRTLVEAGLPAEVAEAALTTEAARLLGVGNRVGRIAPGYDATLVIWDRDPLLEKAAQPEWIIVDGFATRFERNGDGEEGFDDDAPPEADVTGTWVSESAERGSSMFVLTMAADGALRGKLHTRRPGGDEMVGDLSGRVRGRRVELEATLRTEDFEIEVSGTLRVEGEEMTGEMSYLLPFREEPVVFELSATRDPENWSPPYSCHEEHGRS